MKSARLFAASLLLALPCLTSCATVSSETWKQRAQQCRQPPDTPIEDAPGAFVEMPAYLVHLLAVIRTDREKDRVEWACIADP